MITEADLSPLFDAVPSFRPTWLRYRADVEPSMVAHDFCVWLAGHLAESAADGDFSEFGPFFGALDQLYRVDNEELSTALTVGLLEDLMHIAEDNGVAMERISREITGSEARRFWDAAYAYTHSPSREKDREVQLIVCPQLTISGGTSMPIESVAEHERIWVEALNRGDVSAADAVFAPDCVIHITGVAEPLKGLGPWKGLVSGLLATFPDLHFTIEEQLIEGDRVACRWHATGTHRGPLGAAPATGKSVALDGLIIDHLVNGKVKERWEQWDQSLMLQQLGVA